MDNLENQPSPSPTPNQDDLQGQLASVASLVNSVLILLLVLAGAVDYYLFRQASLTRDELVATRQYSEQFVQRNQAIDQFVRKLADYGRTHADFAPIYAKYGLKDVQSASPAPATGMPLPATNSKTKK